MTKLQLWDAIGVSTTQAINMFYQQIKYHNGIPFEVKIPNSET
ncbi:MAG TPA: hypothetical protein EYG94_09030 [Campylobacterales bacterium]|nr:hypothetical protein [Campylobacterales bacterium]